jgi:HSP20 family molecular chaperone IbpA
MLEIMMMTVSRMEKSNIMFSASNRVGVCLKMTKKLPLTPFLIIGIFSYLVSASTAQIFAQEEFEIYRSEEFGFAVEHPSDWKAEEPSSYEIELIGHRPYVIRMELPSSLEDDISTRTNRPQVTIDMERSDSGSLEQYVSEQIDRTVSITPNMDIKSNETTLAGLPAYTVVMTSPGGGGKGMDIYTMTDEGIIYNVDYTAHPDKFNTYLAIVHRMVESFKIT